MPPNFSRDYERGLRCMRHMKAIIGVHLISEAPAEEDMHHNTDLLVLSARDCRVACRLRNDIPYLSLYGHEFTIREARPLGTRTELEKVLAGLGNYILYGFAPAGSERMSAWMLGDLDVFRHRYLTARSPLGRRVRNPDGTWFRAFGYHEFPSDFIVAQHALLPMREAA